MGERTVRQGWVAPELADELPGLGVYALVVDARPAKTPPPIRLRMRELANRIGGARVVQARQDTVPWSYRVLWRRLGVDPDVDRTPVERLMLRRLEHGGLPSRGMPDDAVALATLETGVPVVVLDADTVDGEPGLRPAVAGESLGGVEGALRDGEVVYADRRGPLARLDGEVARERAVGEGTSTMLVCALAAAPVSQIEIDEALWTAAEALEASGGAQADRSPGGAA